MRTIIFLVASLTFAKPVLPPRDEPAKIPPLTGSCQWGKIEQNGRDIAITGDSWTAIGEVRPSGFVAFYWLNAGVPAIGVYKRDGDNLVGHWGWCSQVTLDGNDLCGTISSETIRVTREKK